MFWRHHYIGAQGVIFVIDGSDESTEVSIEELRQLLKERSLVEVPICIFINKSDLPKKEGLE